jgi:hypothetical protein
VGSNFQIRDDPGENVREEFKKTRQPGRSFLLIVLTLGFLLFSLTGWLRLYLSFLDWQLLTSLGLYPGPLYLAIYGTITGLFGVIAVVGLWLRRSWAPTAARIGALAVAALYWFDRLLFTQSASNWVNWPFSAGMTLVLLLFVFLALPAPVKGKFFNSSQDRAGEIVEESTVSHEQNKR